MNVLASWAFVVPAQIQLFGEKIQRFTVCFFAESGIKKNGYILLQGKEAH